MLWLDWMSLFVRWFHVVAGVAWIGASFYFIWLDNNLREPPKWKKDQGIKGDLWAVHGGGFYEVAKYQYGPQSMPQTLHWFKWEAYSTWLSGMLLLVLVYYFGASAYLIDPSVNAMSPTTAIVLGLALIFGGLAVYEFACRSPLAQYPKLFGLVLFSALTLASWLASQWFSGRGAFIHIGALIGTLMAANVFIKIMPSQRKMVAAVADRQTVDPKWGEEAKLRSVHNNYFTLPLLFIMISNHYPVTYQHPQNWLVLMLIGLIAAWIRHYFNLKHVGQKRPAILISGALAMLALTFWVSMPQTKSETAPGEQVLQPSTPLAKDTQRLIQSHCVSCHADSPSDPMFNTPPLGLVLSSWQDIELKSAAIYQRTVVTKDMPFLNKTGMTDKEREVIGRWFLQRQAQQ